MSKFLRILVALVVSFALAECHVLSFLQQPKHDGIQRVCRLNRNNLTGNLAGLDTTVVIIGDGQDFGTQKCPSEVENFAELTAQLLVKRNVIVCGISLDEFKAIEKEIQPQIGDIYIYKGQNRYTYYGRRTAPSLLTFVQKLNSSQVHTISGRIDKIAFDAAQQIKLVGFFMQGTADFAAYEEAAVLLGSRVAFYAAFDRTVAQHLKLDTVGQINLVKPYQKQAIPCPINPASVADIQNFVNSNQGVLLNYLTEHSIYDPQIIAPNKTLFLAIGETTTPIGNYFYRLLTKLIKINFNTTEFQQLSIVWVDPQIFPTVNIMLDELSATYGIPTTLPAFGTINSTKEQSAWFDLALLNTTGDKNVDEINVLLLQEWITGVMNQTILPLQTGVQGFLRQPSSQAAAEGSDMTLECVVQSKVGDCLWLRNGQNIGFNLARYPQYSWRGDSTGGDCSLVISGAQQARDGGKWVCQVTGDQNNPTITSTPATIVLTAAVPAKPEL